jgi:hypothetical protein
MNDAEYRALVQSAYDGRLVIGVDRIYARKLYTEISTSALEEATGESPYFEKLVVWFAYIGSPLAMLTSAILAGFTFRWWVLLVVPVGLILSTINSVFARRGSSSIWFLTPAVVAAVTVHFMKLLANPWLSAFIATLAFALWCKGFLYCASTFFLRAFVLRNQRALEAFGEGIRIREADRAG